MKLTGKVALITNVSEFMGPAITEEFCREGASVALHDRNEAAAEVIEGAVLGIDEAAETTKYCRNCELACPVAARTPGRKPFAVSA